MTGRYVQRGESIDFLNNTGATILAGQLVAYGDKFYVAGCEMKKGELGTLHTFGVFQFPVAEPGTFAPGNGISYTAGDAGVKAGAGFGICVEAVEKTVAVGDFISVMLENSGTNSTVPDKGTAETNKGDL